MRVLVTGANGYIASNLIRYLIAKKHKVAALEQESSILDKLKDFRGSIDIFRVKNDFESVSHAVSKTNPDVVVHLAALTIVEHRPEQIEPLLSSNVLFPALLLEAMLKNGVKCMVNTGSFWEYAKNPVRHQALNLYAASKIAFEQILHYYEDVHGFRCVTLKLYGVYGPFDLRGKIFCLFKQSINTKNPVLFSPGRQRLDLIYIGDIVCAFEKAIRYVLRKNNSKHENFFIGSGKSVELRKIAGTFENCIGKPLNIKWGGRPYRSGEIMNSRADISLARRKLNWRPRFILKDGIRKMLKTEGEI